MKIDSAGHLVAAGSSLLPAGGNVGDLLEWRGGAPAWRRDDEIILYEQQYTTHPNDYTPNHAIPADVNEIRGEVLTTSDLGISFDGNWRSTGSWGDTGNDSGAWNYGAGAGTHQIIDPWNALSAINTNLASSGPNTLMAFDLWLARRPNNSWHGRMAVHAATWWARAVLEVDYASALPSLFFSNNGWANLVFIGVRG